MRPDLQSATTTAVAPMIWYHWVAELIVVLILAVDV